MELHFQRQGIRQTLDFGTMPLLATMNITGNNYVTITPKHFANLCNLQILYNSNVTATYDLCDCWIINRWLGERGVKFDTLECPEDKNRCTNAALSERDEKNLQGMQRVVRSDSSHPASDESGHWRRHSNFGSHSSSHFMLPLDEKKTSRAKSEGKRKWHQPNCRFNDQTHRQIIKKNVIHFAIFVNFLEAICFRILLKKSL
ncbi:hypothetical protein NQ318_008020 [Aromia moschata]|uniref:Uncharacterized protein n=1 Tax=Aromia moschata TaxID=1265417 RepID=A0AAV8XJW0_9CUCU|nr:hypothetical protein NQ318_008020 [Aromia moschata]